MNAPTPRPQTWLVFGILDIVFGALGIIGGLFSAVIVYVKPAIFHQSNAVQNSFDSNALYQVWVQCITPFGVIFSVYQIVVGVWLVRFRPGARRHALAYSGIDIGYKLLGTGVMAIVAMQIWHQVSHQSGPMVVGAMVGVIGGVIAMPIGMIFPGLQLWFLRNDPYAVVAAVSGVVRSDDGNPYQPPMGR